MITVPYSLLCVKIETGFFFALLILPKLRWFSTADWQVGIFLFCFICAVAFNRDHCKESCAPSRNSSPSQKTVKNCCPIYKKAAEDTFTMGRVLDGIRLSGMLRSENVLLYSFLSASTIFSGGGTKIFRLIGFAIKGCYFATAPKSAFS